ncbi:cache domain-containing protein [Pseudomonas sp. App30]|uniref:cache domain-containing protein n=1 Tax=Pseudomonas sp. App30 TaxID=3068990 RepID=UPI003A805AC8
MNRYLAAGLGFWVSLGHATDAPQDAQASALLKRAVDYYQVQGDAALPAFSRQGEFIDADRFIFVVDSHGTLLASGGNSAVLIGREISKVLAPELNAAFADAFDNIGKQGVQSVEYRWDNKAQHRIELKRVYFQKVGDRVIAATQSVPRASAEQAVRLLENAVAAMQQNPMGTVKAINDLSADFREDDLYVFVVDARTHRYVAHGYNLRLLGVDFTSIHDPAGRPVGQPIVALMRNATSAKYEYRWKNPVTGIVEDKYALIRKAGDYLVVVGYYRGAQAGVN